VKAAAVTESGLERAIRQDRLIVALALAIITLLSWAYLLRMAAMMNAAAMDAEMHAAMGMPEMRAWGPTEFAMLFLMWAVMMIGMMLPSAGPIILLVAGTYRRRGDRSRVLALPFVAGYLIAWTAFSAVAAVVQIILHRTALLSPSMATSSVSLGGA
jgi:predicted metal-binding membrane protein